MAALTGTGVGFGRSCLLLLLFLLMLAPAHADEHAIVSPSVFETFLLPGRHDRFTLSVERGGGALAYQPADIVFLLDATGSMNNIIGTMQSQAVDILRKLRRQNQKTAFGVASFGDYPLYHGADPVWMMQQDITADADHVIAALRTIRPMEGGDLPEAYSRALYEMLFVHWRPGAQRFVLLFGDAPAHDPDFYGRDLGVDPGRDGISGTADDLRFADVVSRLAAAHITVIGIYDRGPWYRRKPLGEETRKGFEYAAKQTGGIAVPVTASNEVGGAILRGFAEIRPPVPAVRPAGAYSKWALVAPGEAADAKGLAFRFPITVTPPKGTAAGIYEIPLQVVAGPNANAGQTGASAIRVRVGWLYYPWRWIVIALLALLLLLAVLLPTAGSRRAFIRMVGRPAGLGLLWRVLLLGGVTAALVAATMVLPPSLGDLLGG